MSKLTYRVVKHDGGWAYEANGTYSEPFRTRDSARMAAKIAASEQTAAGETTHFLRRQKRTVAQRGGQRHRSSQNVS
jgi:hypothetical protein